jgi:hypothetical protein
MPGHKFEIGRIVRSQPRQDSVVPPGSYEIVRHLPSGDAERDPQYRVKSTLDGHERIVKESDLN